VSRPHGALPWARKSVALRRPPGCRSGCTCPLLTRERRKRPRSCRGPRRCWGFTVTPLTRNPAKRPLRTFRPRWAHAGGSFERTSVTPAPPNVGTFRAGVTLRGEGRVLTAEAAGFGGKLRHLGGWPRAWSRTGGGVAADGQRKLPAAERRRARMATRRRRRWRATATSTCRRRSGRPTAMWSSASAASSQRASRCGSDRMRSPRLAGRDRRRGLERLGNTVPRPAPTGQGKLSGNRRPEALSTAPEHLQRSAAQRHLPPIARDAAGSSIGIDPGASSRSPTSRT